ncbi:MAG TPA: hypothetical protein VJU59_17780 [Paraburkholderia sp.]|uniref:hypothetical protein n=1 Tax=Paraburkholderia sp. TaxID=1926495 RepID=UPI002B45A891|nr:hypothetical protein [Paraburkholderia sp.]HKR41497.1 hypothetical protein [Paraburkholderia sp.]
MKALYEVEGIASRLVNHVESPGERQTRPSGRTTSESAASSTCATNFPMLTPHEIATLMLVAHTPGQVSIERPDLLPLLNGDLVAIDRCPRCQGKPQVTPLGEILVVRFCKATRQASKNASSILNLSLDHH